MTSCLALLAMLISFALTLVHFLPGHGSGAGALLKIPLPPWRPYAHTEGLNSRFADFGTLIPWLAPVWIAGVCICSLRYAVGWISLQRVRQRGVCNAPKSWQDTVTRLAIEVKISRPVVLLESLLADTPVVLGHFRPVILAPLGFLASLLPDQVEAILSHELAHIRRSDYLVNVCQRVIEALLFYHPAVWWISKVIRAERENCCDDMVVDLRGNAHAYAAALTTLEHSRLEQHRPTRKAAVASTGGNLVKRIKRLLYPKGSSGVWAPTLAAIVLMASTATAFAAWHVNPNAGVASQLADPKTDNSWQTWLNEDVLYIITDEEKSAFEGLKTDEERHHFVEQFWARRDPYT